MASKAKNSFLLVTEKDLKDIGFLTVEARLVVEQSDNPVLGATGQGDTEDLEARTAVEELMKRYTCPGQLQGWIPGYKHELQDVKTRRLKEFGRQDAHTHKFPSLL